MPRTVQTLKVLLVEDNPGDADLIVETAALQELRKLDIDVRRTLADGIGAAHSGGYDAILLDLGLPDSNGVNTFEWLHSAVPAVPVIVLTGHDDAKVAERCMELGAHDFLVKGRVEAFIAQAVFNTVARTTAQRALAESHESMKRLIADSHDAIAVLDAGNVVRFANQAAIALLGARCTVGNRFLVSATAEQEVDIPRDAGGPATVDMTVNESVWYGKPARVVFLRDVTRRKRAEQQLNAERDNLKAFIAAAPVCIFVADNDGVVNHANAAAGQLFSRANPLSQPLRFGDIISCVNRHHSALGCGFGPQCADCRLFWALREGLAGHAVQNVEVGAEVEGTEGTQQRHYLASAAPVNREGSPEVVLTLSDVTEARRAQRDREAMQATLAQTDRLATMGTLAAGVAHEINNPLAYVISNLEALADDLDCLHQSGDQADPVRAARLVAALGRATEAAGGAMRIRQISRSLGSFSRVEDTEVAPVRVEDAIEHALTMALNELKYRARVVRDYGALPPVLASEGKLAQVFLNLFINAAHAIGEGQVDQNEVRVHTFVKGGQACIEVSDTGKGIAPAHRDRLFQPFFTTKGVGVGSGLGLSICRRIITGFGGTIELTSDCGPGARFTLTLPLAPGNWVDATAPTPDVALAPLRGRVLVVDDEAPLRAALVRVLGRDHEVVALSSGAEARLLLETDRHFDVVFTDLMMPEVSGMDLHASLVASDPTLAARVVFITGGAFTPGATQYLAGVKNLKVDKPFDSKQLRQLTLRLVHAARAGADGQLAPSRGTG